MEAGYSLRRGQGKNLPVSLTLEHVSPVTRLLDKRKKMLHVQESLDAQKEEYQRKEELFKRREENLRKKDLELQEALVSFNKFLKENEHKRRRADHRANEEIRKRQKWEKEIILRKKTLVKLELDLQKLRGKVKKNEKYSAYLEDVRRKFHSHFDGVDSIILRHGTLEEAHNDLLKKQAECTEKHEQFRQRIIQFKKERYNNALILNNKSAVMSKQLEEHVKSTNEYQERLIYEENIDAERRAKTTQIIHSAENLYVRCRKVGSKIKHSLNKLSAKEREGLSAHKAREADTCSKLDVVDNYLKDFDSIVTRISGASTMPFRNKSAYQMNYTALTQRYGQNANPALPRRPRNNQTTRKKKSNRNTRRTTDSTSYGNNSSQGRSSAMTSSSLGIHQQDSNSAYFA
jgi:hypothetical protein